MGSRNKVKQIKVRLRKIKLKKVDKAGIDLYWIVSANEEVTPTTFKSRNKSNYTESKHNPESQNDLDIAKY